MPSSSPCIIVYLSHPTVRDVTVFRLRLLGLNAIGVASDESMTQVMAEALPDVLIIDLDLESGFSWIERLANDECTSHIPIMTMSTKGDLEVAEKAVAAGALELLLIPYDPELLDDKIDSLISLAADRKKHISEAAAQ